MGRAENLEAARHVRHQAAIDRIRALMEAATPEALRHVPKLHRDVLEKRAAGATLQEVGDALGITKEGAAWRQREGLHALAQAGLLLMARRLAVSPQDRAALLVLEDEAEW